MIEKFNFYDIYGYFLPGLALIAVLWLPFGLVLGKWPSGDIASAVFDVALAYFAGHMMLYVSTDAIPSYDVERSVTKIRYPSQTVLDQNNAKIPKEGKDKIAEAVGKEFQLELGVKDSTGEFDGNRQTAFELARQRLSLEKLQSYAEQFQGMYSLARGLVVAFSVGAAYYSGWVLSTPLHCPLLVLGVVVVLVFLLLYLMYLTMAIKLDVKWKRRMWHEKVCADEVAAQAQQKDEWKRRLRLKHRFGWACLLAFLAAGWIAGFVYKVSPGQRALLASAAAIAVVLSFLCYGQYRSFTTDFAKTVWLNFTTFALRDRGNQNMQINVNI